MRVNIEGLINRLDDLRERLNDLLDNLDGWGEEDIEIENVQRYFQNDDTFNLAIALGVLRQADKLDKALEIIKEKNIEIDLLKKSENAFAYNKWSRNVNQSLNLTDREFDFLKEVSL